ncbi:MAG: TlpA disulfide reductase family protein [Bacteroidota bacterium]
MKIVMALVLSISCIAANAQIKVGDIAPEIALPGINGDTVKLSSFKGKVVMIDFWASWCGPCRKSNPHVQKLYEKFKDKGFEVLGVSIDNRKESWIKAIRKDKIKYTQVLDGEGWDANTAVKFGVDAIPATFLLNKEGVIVAVDLEGKELEEKIRELL